MFNLQYFYLPTFDKYSYLKWDEPLPVLSWHFNTLRSWKEDGYSEDGDQLAAVTRFIRVLMHFLRVQTVWNCRKVNAEVWLSKCACQSPRSRCAGPEPLVPHPLLLWICQNPAYLQLVTLGFLLPLPHPLPPPPPPPLFRHQLYVHQTALACAHFPRSNLQPRCAMFAVFQFLSLSLLLKNK